MDRARDAQSDFERLRRRHFVRGGWPSSRCDEHIGRFCLTHDGDDDWSPVPEHEEVAERRLELIALLDSTERRLPRNDWVAGQKVKYLLEAGHAARALEAARSCGGDRGWCESLVGFALHAQGRGLEAEDAFARAAEAMTAAERCATKDIAWLLADRDRHVWEALGCGSPEREAFEGAFWHLSEPLWSIPERKRRTEHLARHVWRGIQHDAGSGYGLSWGADLQEITVRYGWPAGWDVAWRRDPGIRTERSIEAHRAPHAQRFIVEGVSDTPVWNLEDEEPRATWAPFAGPVAEPAGFQLAAFRRGDAGLWVATLRPDGDYECGDVSILLSSGTRVIASARGGAAVAATEPGPGTTRYTGIEAACGPEPAAVRVRVPAPRSGKWLSDLLLLDPAETLPGTLDATFPHVRPDGVVRPGESIVVFWEWYGPADPMTVTLTLSRENKGFWRKALEFVGLADRQIERTGVRWSEAGPGGESPRAILIELPDLAGGEYALTLDVQTARLGTVSSMKEIVVRR